MISFVVPAYNEERYLAATLASIHDSARSLALEYEVVVANDASTDATVAIAEQGGARVVSVSNRQISKTRNDGARAATGERLVFVDGDTQVNAGVVGAALAALDDGFVGGGAGATFDGAAPGWAHGSISLVMGTLRLLNMAAGCFVFCRRDAFMAAGGFDERHFAGEELMFSLALKRHGRFVVLREAVTTSSRKFLGRTPWQTLVLVVRLLARGLGGVRRREDTQFWYDGRR